ncbi:MAG: hypothetical protein ACMXYC_05095 [Candidatus Woesearchaeota archaeon]
MKQALLSCLTAGMLTLSPTHASLDDRITSFTQPTMLPAVDTTLDTLQYTLFSYDTPGVGAVEYHTVDNPYRIMVHVKQIHFMPQHTDILYDLDTADKALLEIKKRYPDQQEINIDAKLAQSQEVRDQVKAQIVHTSKVQKDIFDLFRYTVSEHGIDQIYVENFTSDNIHVLQNMTEDDFNYNMYTLLGTRIFDEEYKNNELDSFGYYLGAYTIASIGGLITPKAAECIDIRRQIDRTIPSDIKMSDLETIASFDELRENATVRLLEDPINIVVYGGAHCFKNNIDEWNAQNPQTPYSLIIVTPTSYTD